MPKTTHGGKRKGAGRKPALLPLHTKKLRASEDEWREFMSHLTGDARHDFVALLVALRFVKWTPEVIKTRNELMGWKND